MKLSQARDEAIDTLSTQYANDEFDLSEYERRIELVHKAETVADVAAATQTSSNSNNKALARREQTALAQKGNVPKRQSLAAVFGGVSKKGSWVVPRKLRLWTMMGGAELDFREAQFGPGVSELRVSAMMGGVSIIVPPNIRTEVHGSGFFGSFEGEDNDATDPDAPVLRITGFAFMGGVEVSEQKIGESAREARKRLRAERKQRQLNKNKNRLLE